MPDGPVWEIPDPPEGAWPGALPVLMPRFPLSALADLPYDHDPMCEECRALVVAVREAKESGPRPSWLVLPPTVLLYEESEKWLVVADQAHSVVVAMVEHLRHVPAWVYPGRRL